MLSKWRLILASLTLSFGISLVTSAQAIPVTSQAGNPNAGCNQTPYSSQGMGANQSGPYNDTCTGAPSQNGSGVGQATGRPCAGCVGNADEKNPPGQMPNGSDRNAGYECDSNHGIGQTNPAHTGCTQATITPTPMPCTVNCNPVPCVHNCTPVPPTSCSVNCPSVGTNCLSNCIGSGGSTLVTSTSSVSVPPGQGAAASPVALAAATGGTLPATGADAGWLVALLGAAMVGFWTYRRSTSPLKSLT